MSPNILSAFYSSTIKACSGKNRSAWFRHKEFIPVYLHMTDISELQIPGNEPVDAYETANKKLRTNFKIA